jgi:hypothetical protein
MYGQAQPWERAGIDYGLWLEVLRYATKRHVEAANLASSFFEKGGKIDLREVQDVIAKDHEWTLRYRAVFLGDKAEIERLENELKPTVEAPQAT